MVESTTTRRAEVATETQPDWPSIRRDCSTCQHVRQIDSHLRHHNSIVGPHPTNNSIGWVANHAVIRNSKTNVVLISRCPIYTVTLHFNSALGVLMDSSLYELFHFSNKIPSYKHGYGG